MRWTIILSRAALGPLLAVALGACSSASTAAPTESGGTAPENGVEDNDGNPAQTPKDDPAARKDAGHQGKDAGKSSDAGASADAGSSDAGPGADAGPPIAACATDQIDQPLSTAGQQALIQQFMARNGNAWSATSTTPTPITVNAYTAAIRSGERTDAPGPAQTVNKAQATATSIAFLQSNWDLLGFRTAAGPGTIKGAFDLADGAPGFHLQFDSTEKQAGYEHVKNGELWLRFRIQIGSDGKVRSFQQIAITTFPPMTMEPYPTLSPTEMRAKLNGVQLYGTNVKVTATDAVDFETIELYPTAAGQSLYASWWMQINGKGRVYWWALDGCTGEVRHQGTEG